MSQDRGKITDSRKGFSDHRGGGGGGQKPITHESPSPASASQQMGNRKANRPRGS